MGGGGGGGVDKRKRSFMQYWYEGKLGGKIYVSITVFVISHCDQLWRLYDQRGHYKLRGAS